MSTSTCPACARVLDVTNRLSGDAVLCACEAWVLVQHTAQGTRLSLCVGSPRVPGAELPGAGMPALTAQLGLGTLRRRRR